MDLLPYSDPINSKMLPSFPDMPKDVSPFPIIDQNELLFKFKSYNCKIIGSHLV